MEEKGKEALEVVQGGLGVFRRLVALLVILDRTITALARRIQVIMLHLETDNMFERREGRRGGGRGGGRGREDMGGAEGGKRTETGEG